MSKKLQPIRIFWSELSNRFYASRQYTIRKNGVVVIHGQKFDVTDDIAHLVLTYDIEFNKDEPHPKI